jgi:hypothetical protein
MEELQNLPTRRMANNIRRASILVGSADAELKIVTTEQRARELGEYLIMAANSSGRTGACVNLILDIGPSALRVRVYVGTN